MARRTRRNTLRHRGHDYRSPGDYFVTAVTHDRLRIFGDIRKGRMILNHQELRKRGDSANRFQDLCPTIVGSAKSAVTKQINRQRGTPGGVVWQRNFHDHIIRDGQSLERIREYIRWNPMQWTEDRNNPRNSRRRSAMSDLPLEVEESATAS